MVSNMCPIVLCGHAFHHLGNVNLSELPLFSFYINTFSATAYGLFCYVQSFPDLPVKWKGPVSFLEVWCSNYKTIN